MSWKDDKTWSDRFIPAIKQLVGPQLLEPAPLEIDMEEATDLIVLRAKDMRIACRVRRPGYADKYPWDITLRKRRESGAKTELAKIVEGWGDWMFYGHAHEDGRSFARWFLIDLHMWRQRICVEGVCMCLGEKAGKRPLLTNQSNGDGTHFVTFDVRDFPRKLVIASSHPILKAVPKPRTMPAPRPRLNGASGLHR